MFQFLLGVLLRAFNFLESSRALTKTGAGSGRGVRTTPIRGRARCAALVLGLALLPAGANAQNAYITNSFEHTVSVIDTATNKVTATIPVNGAYGVAVTRDGSKAYITNRDGGPGLVSVIDTTSNTVIATIPVSYPGGVAVTPDGTKAYIANGPFSTISVIDTATNTVVATIPVDYGPNAIAITPDGTKAYFTLGGAVSVIDTATNTVVATIPFADGAYGVAVTPDGTKVYVTNNNQPKGAVSVIDTASNSVVATIPVGSQPVGVAVTPDGTKVYVTNSVPNNTNSTVSVIDTVTNTVTATVPVGRGPFGVAVTPEGAKAYVANNVGNTVSVIATATNTVVATIPVGSGPVAFGKFIGGPAHGSPPVAVNETAATTANTPVPIDLTIGATGNPTSAALVGTPVGGTVAGFPATTVTFTPTTGFTGTASFQFTLANAFGTSNTATATITVTPPSPPVAMPLAKTTPQGTPVTIDLSEGATGNPTSSAIVLRPAHGVAKIVSGTLATYTPNAPFVGTDSFTFTLANAFGKSNAATATITVTGVAPTAAPQSVPITAGVPVKFNLAKGASGKPTSAAIVSGPALGKVAISGTTATYTPASCFVGTDSFQFTLTNAYGTSSPAKATITASTVTSPAIEVHLVHPFLLGVFRASPRNMDLSSLYRTRNWLDVEARGLVADGVSAAIAVIQTNDCTNDVSLSTTNGTKLIPYRPDFLIDAAKDPKGETTLPITGGDLLLNIVGGFFFGAALVQAPPADASAPSFSDPIVVTAQQGSLTPPPAQAALVPPPVVLVHGDLG